MLHPLQVSLALRPQFQQFCKTEASVSCLGVVGQTRHHLSPAPQKRGLRAESLGLELHTPGHVLPPLPAFPVS